MFYQETLEVIFYSLLDLSRLHTCSQGGQSDMLLHSLSEGAQELKVGSSLLFTHLNEPLSQQIYSLGHGRVVVGKLLDDKFWRTTRFKIPVRQQMSLNTGKTS